VSEDFEGGDDKVAAMPMHRLLREIAAPQATN
jgi:hypothetical protein